MLIDSLETAFRARNAVHSCSSGRYVPRSNYVTFVNSILPGTFLILNGAVQGFAGFGLANDPNLSALLYDPSMPFNQRISILNTTIVARLYHSEVSLFSPEGTANGYMDNRLFSFQTDVFSCPGQTQKAPSSRRSFELKSVHSSVHGCPTLISTCRFTSLRTWYKASPSLRSVSARTIQTGRMVASMISP